mgnify:CR=1 FL=1
MALPRSFTRLDLPTQQTVGEGLDRESLLALSQRKLNALGLPVCYIDVDQRYRFVNRAFLDWSGKPQDEVIGREVVEVDGRELYQLYHAYLEAALDRRARELRAPAFVGQAQRLLDPRRLLPRSRTARRRPRRARDLHRRRQHQSDWSSRRASASIACASSPTASACRSSISIAQFRLRFANKPYGDYIGVAVDDLLGQPLKNFAAADALDEMHGIRRAARSPARPSATSAASVRPAASCAGCASRCSPIASRGRKTGGAFAVINDIEDDVRIREALKSQEVAAAAVRRQHPRPDRVSRSRRCKYTFVNQAFANWVCRPQDEIYGKTPYEVMPHDVNAFLRPIIKRAQEGENVEYERVGTSADGRAPLDARPHRARPRCGSGKVRGLYCTEYDIHDLKLTEQALAAREEQLRLFTDNIPEPVVYVDADRSYTFVNDAFLQPGRASSRDEVIGKSREGRARAERPSSSSSRSSTARARGESVDLRARRPIDVNGRAARGCAARSSRTCASTRRSRVYYVVGHDITDLKQAQDALAARGIAAARDHGRRAGAGRVHRPRRALPVRQPHVPAVFRPDRASRLRACGCATSSATASTQSAQAMLSRALRRRIDGVRPAGAGRGCASRRWMTIRVVPDAAPSGEVHGAFVLMNDIHGLKQAQEALRAQRGRAAAHHGQRAGARRVHRPRIAFRFPQPAQRGMAVGEAARTSPGGASREVVGDARATPAAAADRPRCSPARRSRPSRCWCSRTASSGGSRSTTRPTATPKATSIGIYAVHTDIHDQKRNEEALRRANWMLSSHINNTPLAVLEWDRDFGLSAGRRRRENIFGWRAEEVLGHADHRQPADARGRSPAGDAS